MFIFSKNTAIELKATFLKAPWLIIFMMVNLLWTSGCDKRTPTIAEKDIINYHLIVTSDKAVIYADNGKTLARITAYLTDEAGVPKSGSTILFYPSQGKMVGTVSTDQTGRAISNFDDDDPPEVT